jgi:MtN3 and saliva related transmembrane protein
MSDWVGYTAAVLTTAAFLPQVLKSFRSGETKHISLGMYVLFCSGIVLWLIYGLMLHALPIIFANVTTLILAGAILFMKLRNG